MSGSSGGGQRPSRDSLSVSANWTCEECGEVYTQRRLQERCNCRRDSRNRLVLNPFNLSAPSARRQHTITVSREDSVRKDAGSSRPVVRERENGATDDNQEAGSCGDDMPDISTYDVGAGDNFGGAGGDFGGGVGDDFGGAGDDFPSADGPPEDDDGVGDDGGINDVMARIEKNLAVIGTNTGTDDEDGSSDCGDEHSDIGLDDERYDDFQGDVDNRGSCSEPEVFLLPEDGGGASSVPRLDVLHTMAPSFASCKTAEGGPEKLRHNTKARGSPFYPFATKEQQLLFVWIHVHRISKRALRGLLEILLLLHEGQPFDVNGLAGVDPEHFYGRMRPYLPMLQLLERDVPSTHDGGTSSVYDIPVNLLLDRVMQIQSETALSEAYPGGKILRGEEAAANRLTSDHINCVPTRQEGNVMNSNQNGTLARSTPFFGFDGIRARVCGRKVYVNDTCVAEVEGVVTLCRMLKIFYDEARQLVIVTVRLFRGVSEVRGVRQEERRGGLLRVWEDCTADGEVELKADAVLGLVEMETPHEMAPAGGSQGGHNFPWDRFVGEGFVRRTGTKRPLQSSDLPKPFTVSESPWCMEGPAERPLWGLRRSGVHFNDTDLPFFSASLVFNCDAFNAFGMGCKHSVGGSYFGWAWRAPAVQRLKHQSHVGTLASPGACCRGEIGLQCEVLGLLQNGCLGRAKLTDQEGAAFEQEVFVRGGLLLMCGDGQGRSKFLGTKAPNSWSRHPCAYCMVRQRTDDTSGDLGNPRFDIDKHRRTWGQITKGFEELHGLADDPRELERRSKELGLVEPDASGLPLPLYDAMRVVPTENVPVERLHFDALGQSQLCQIFFLEMLSTAGRRLVGAIMAQKPSLLYPPGTGKIKDIVTNYASLTGSDKWTLQSIMLLVFRMVLQNVPAMRRNMNTREINGLKAEWGTYEGLLEALRELMIRSSLLSFALRAPSFTEPELRQLDKLARDAVEAFSKIMGRTGSRPTIHSILHTVETIRLHGLCPDASTCEHTHQTNKSGRSVDCGRNPSKHMAQRANVNSALLALSNGLPYSVTRYNRQDRVHEIVSVRPGDGCVRLMKSLASLVGHDGVPTDIHAEAVQTPAQLRGQFPGSAVWTASLFKTGDEQRQDGDWLLRVASSKFRPDGQTLLRGYKKYYGCDMSGTCTSSRCPNCWGGDGALEYLSIDCSRCIRVPMAASCGLGRLKGGDVKSTSQPGPRDEWALGSGGGDNVEVHKQASAWAEVGRADPRDLNLVKVLYFFRHKGNRPLMGGHPPPLTWWVLGYEYTGIGHANDRVTDSVTGHPTLQLRARGRPEVYPVSAIYRQVHLYHACPLNGDPETDGSQFCGVAGGGGSSHGGVWRHRFRQATPGTAGYDRYLYNECHHSINQDTFV
ncbi:unnamed protein product [Ectocarpus sp. CCAP 1310/34]|nr:unnamed protein product [Ectocarpus sp. CCAP 1310/34]